MSVGGILQPLQIRQKTAKFVEHRKPSLSSTDKLLNPKRHRLSRVPPGLVYQGAAETPQIVQPRCLMLTPFRPATEAQNAVLMAQNTVTISSPGRVGGYKKDQNATVRLPCVRAPTEGRHNGQSAQVLSFPLFLVALSPGPEKVREAPTSIVSVFYSGGRCKVSRYLQPPHRLSFSSIFQCHRRPLAKSCFLAQERCARCSPPKLCSHFQGLGSLARR